MRRKKNLDRHRCFRARVMLPVQKSLNIWPPAEPQPKSNSHKPGEVILVRGFFWQAPPPFGSPFSAPLAAALRCIPHIPTPGCTLTDNPVLGLAKPPQTHSHDAKSGVCWEEHSWQPFLCQPLASPTCSPPVKAEISGHTPQKPTVEGEMSTGSKKSHAAGPSRELHQEGGTGLPGAPQPALATSWMLLVST